MKHYQPPRVANIDGEVRIDLAWLISGLVIDMARDHLEELEELREVVRDLERDGNDGSDFGRSRIDAFADPIAKALGTDMVLTHVAAAKLADALWAMSKAA